MESRSGGDAEQAHVIHALDRATRCSQARRANPMPSQIGGEVIEPLFEQLRALLETSAHSSLRREQDLLQQFLQQNLRIR